MVSLHEEHFKRLESDPAADLEPWPSLGLPSCVPYEVDNKFFWLDVNNPNGGLCFADKALLTNGVAPAGNGFFEYCGRRAQAMPGQYKPFAPRVGFAYRPSVGRKQ